MSSDNSATVITVRKPHVLYMYEACFNETNKQ